MEYWYSVKNPSAADIAAANGNSLGPEDDAVLLGQIGQASLPYHLLKYDQAHEFAPSTEWAVELTDSDKLQASLNEVYKGVTSQAISEAANGTLGESVHQFAYLGNYNVMQKILRNKVEELVKVNAYNPTFDAAGLVIWLMTAFNMPSMTGVIAFALQVASQLRPTETDPIRIEVLDDIIEKCLEYRRKFPDLTLVV